jgi:hypothetical protein
MSQLDSVMDENKDRTKAAAVSQKKLIQRKLKQIKPLQNTRVLVSK